MASFVSSKDLESARSEKRRARQKLLEQEESKFRTKDEARRRHIESGNDRWMLPGIEQRLEAEAAKISDPAPSKKQKKHKKKKKKKKRATSSESDDSESERKWEEKTTVENLTTKQHENWLNFDDILSNDRTYTSKSIKEKKDEEKKKLQDNRDKEELVGQHPRELNPYWKDGGTGLPSEQDKSHIGGNSNKIHKEWLLRSLKRMNEQAKEQDRTVESIAAERYGSWGAFQRLLQDAESEKRSRGSERKYHKRDGNSKTSFMRPRDDDSDEDRSYKRSAKERRRDRDSGRSRKGDYHPSWKKKTIEQESFKSDFSTKRNKESPEAKSSCMPENREGKWENKSAPQRIIDYRSQAPPCKSDVKVTNEIQISHNVVEPIENPQEGLVPPKLVILSEKEKNQLAAKILKAELMGNEKLANSLKAKLEKCREAEASSKKETPKLTSQTAGRVKGDSESSEEETVVLTRMGKDGQSWPVQHSEMAYDSLPNKRRKKTKMPTHKDGERERYFADDDRHSLQDLVRREKTREAEDENQMFSRLASKQFKGTDSEYFTLDDMYVSEASRQNTRTEEEARQKQKAIANHKKLARRLENCRLCFGNAELPKHLLIAIGEKCYLSLPDHKPLSEGHCIIVPMHHCSTGIGLDEDVWSETRQFMQTLQRMFKSRDMDCVFMQTCIGLKKSRHFFIDCIPLPTEERDTALIYFKKAIQESESEWSHNKKLVDTRGKDLRRCIPKGLPYFSVELGTDGGFAHVVEDEAVFPSYFGREIVGGILDVEPQLWRRPPRDHFTEQTKRSVEFAKWWGPYDWTSDISGTS